MRQAPFASGNVVNFSFFPYQAYLWLGIFAILRELNPFRHDLLKDWNVEIEELRNFSELCGLNVLGGPVQPRRFGRKVWPICCAQVFYLRGPTGTSHFRHEACHWCLMFLH